MVRTLTSKTIETTDCQNHNYIEAAGLSTDTKPTGAVTGSLFLEADTGNVYAYDEVGAAWNKICELGGGA